MCDVSDSWCLVECLTTEHKETMLGYRGDYANNYSQHLRTNLNERPSCRKICAASVLRSILHPPTPPIAPPTRRPRPPHRTLLPAFHLPLIQHTNTATTTTPLDQIIPTTPLKLIHMPNPRPLQHRKHPPQPDPTRQAHRQTMSVRGTMSQQIRRVCRLGLLGETIRGPAGENARAEQARQARRHVGCATAQAMFPRAVAGEVHIRMADLARLVRAVVQAVGAGGRGGGEDGVWGCDGVGWEVVGRVGDGVVCECLGFVAGVRVVGGVWGIFSDGAGGYGGYWCLVGEGAGRLLVASRARTLWNRGHGWMCEICVDG